MNLGVIAGTFDPIHSGHVDFIRRTIAQKSLHRVYLLVEETPRHKPVFAGHADRLKMVQLATRDQPSIEIYDCRVENYPISRCLPKLKQSHKSAKFYLLLGHDVAEHISSWQDSDKLLDGVELVVADRDDGITSGKIRQALAKKQQPNGLDKEVLKYIQLKNIYGSDAISGA